MSPHIVHVAQPTSEGVARCVVGLVQKQVDSHLRVTVLCPFDGWLPREAAKAGAEVVCWDACRDPGPIVAGETFRLARSLRHLRPDLVHLHSAKAGLAGRLAVRGRVPTVYQPHAWSFLAVDGALARATLEWERWALRWTDRVVCVSEAELEAGRGLGKRLLSRASVVRNGIDTEWFRPGDRARARVELGLSDGPLAVCIGRLSRQKGQDLLLQVWPQIVEQVPAARLALVGTGPWREKIAAMAGSDVTMAGNSADPRNWYAAADVVVAPSRWEGMALVPLEAAASGRSVVMTDVAGARESLPPGAGGVVALDDLEMLSRAVAGRLGDRPRCDREGALARQHVVEHHDLHRTAAGIESLYRELLGARL